MRFSTTVLVAVQVSMGLAHTIPPPSTKYLDNIDDWIEEDHEKRGSLTKFRNKFFKGYEVAKSTTRHTFFVPEDNEYESKKHHHDNEHGTTNHHPHDHDSEDRYGTKKKHEPQGHHVSEKPHFKTHHPDKDYNHEEHYHHSESYDNPKTRHHHNDYNDETEYPAKEHEYKKNYLTEAFGPSDNHYRLNEQDFDKYFIKDHDASSTDHESDDIGDSQGSSFKRWTSKGDVMGQWWHPGDPNKKHTHSHKYRVKPRLPDTTGSRKFKYNAKETHDFDEAKEHHSHMFKPGYDSSELKHDYAKEHYKTPNYEKENEEKYGPESEEKHHKEYYSERKEGNSKLKEFYESNFGHNPEEGKFLDDEFYRKQEVDYEDHDFKAKTYRVEHHTHYYDEPGYENVVPGFMWAGPGTVTKTPCASKEGCPYGHWHMLEPKDGEHRRIGITGTNIVVEPDYSRLDYKEDTVNHVLPGYEKVIPGFEWAGPGRVTEVPCPSVTDCPQGGWFMLAPRYGEHRRIAMNYPKATPTPHPHPHPQPHSTMHFHHPGYKPRLPVGYKGGAQDKDHGENEREYKLIHRHPSSMGKRSIEARTPCGKKKDAKKGTEEKKPGTNKPAPRLTMSALLNFEGLGAERRAEYVARFPWMNPELKKEFPTYKELTPRLITLLNEFWATLHEDLAANALFIEMLKRKPKYIDRKRATPELSEEESNKIETLSKRADPVLSEDQIKRIEGSAPILRRVAATRLDFDPNLTEELANARGKFSVDLIAKLNKEYARVMSDPKYKDLRDRYLPNSKKAKRCKKEPEKPKKPKKLKKYHLDKEQIKKIEEQSSSVREMAAKKLDLDPKITAELVKTDKLSDKLIAKLNKEYTRVKNDPKYEDYLEWFFGPEDRIPKKAIERIEELSPMVRAMVGKDLGFSPELIKELIKYDYLSDWLIEKLNVEYRRIKKDPKHKYFIDNFIPKSKRAEPQLSKAMLSKIQHMSPTQRRWAADMLDMDPELTKEFAKAEKFTPGLLKKLNREYARVKNDPKYASILRRLSSSKRAEPQLSKAMISKIQHMSPTQRRWAADMLDMDPELTKEFAKAEKFTPGLLKKLNREYARVKSDPKYASILRRLGSAYKRESETPGITQKQLEQIRGMSSSARKIAALQLGISQELSEEVAYADKFTPELIQKLDKEYKRIKSDPKYNAILEKFGNNKTKRDSYHKELTEHNHLEDSNHEKRQLVPSTTDIPQTDRDPDWEVDLSPPFKYAQEFTEQVIERFGEKIHDKVEEAKKQNEQQKATPSFNATKALDELIAGNSNETVSSQNATDLTASQATSNLNTTALLEPQNAAGQNVTEIAADQAANDQTSTDGDLQDKLEQSKKNGWCNEFLGGIEDTLKKTAKAAQEEVADAVKKDAQNET